MELALSPSQSVGVVLAAGAKPPVPSRICLVTLGGELFAIDLRHVREVFELETVTPVPGMPSILVGVANLRGTVMPLADLRPSLGMSSAASLPFVVVVRHGQQQVGILIDAVPEIRTIHPDDLLTATSRGLSESRPFLSGLAKIEERMSGMMDVQKLLACVEGVLN
ncbi:chemotaxis protein CheW [Nitrospira lenta]|uniref:Putative Chemotaxis protein CheW n=1 Tax=Nitrospira lenta TaxID=1436998 RepID=A0A330LAY3_9BACT|nr:chemotaxis protein CheW [Nitrospira lenta]SPP66464.1 putative Chemotaxis protein CheW [Nitrospira lenta]